MGSLQNCSRFFALSIFFLLLASLSAHMARAQGHLTPALRIDAAASLAQGPAAGPTQVCDATVQVNDKIPFSSTVGNGGQNTLPGTKLTLTVTSALEFVAGTASASKGTWTVQQRQAVLDIGDLAPGETVSWMIDVMAVAVGTGTFTETFTSSNGGSATSSCTITVEDAEPPNFGIGNIDYTYVPNVPNPFSVTITNTGGDANHLYETIITFSSPPFTFGLPTVSGDGQVLGCFPIQNGVTCGIDGFPSGSEINVEINDLVGATDPFTGNVELFEDGNEVADKVFSFAAPVRRMADLRLKKEGKVRMSPSLPGDLESLYTVTVYNDGPGDATGVVVTDSLPRVIGDDKFDWNQSQGMFDWNGDLTMSAGVWQVGNLAAGDSAILVIYIDFDPTTDRRNTAEITAVNEGDPDSTPNNGNVEEDDYDEATPVLRMADLRLKKEGTINRDLMAEYTITVYNDGPDSATDVVVTDSLPSATILRWTVEGTFDPDTGEWQVGNLAVGDSTTLTIVMQFDDTTSDFLNTAEISFLNEGDPDSTPFNGNVEEDDYDEATPVLRMADLQLEKYAEATVDRDSVTVEYTILVFNLGPDDATGVVVTDSLPSAITVKRWTTRQGTFDPDTGVWQVGNLADGKAATLRIDVIIDRTAFYNFTKDLLNTAEITAVNEGDPDSTPNNGDVEVKEDDYARAFPTRPIADAPDFASGMGPGPITDRQRFAADLSLTKEVDNDTPSVGDEIEYTIKVTNGGPQSTTRVQVTDELPDCLDFVRSDTKRRGFYDPDTGIWDVGKLKIGETVTLTITATITADCDGEVVNEGWITRSSLLDPDSIFDFLDPERERDEHDDAVITVQGNNMPAVLHKNYPNPFNPETVIRFTVNKDTHARLTVYDVLGREVAVLVDAPLPPGLHQARFDARHLPAGLYLYRLEAGAFYQTKTMMLLK